MQENLALLSTYNNKNKHPILKKMSQKMIQSSLSLHNTSHLRLTDQMDLP